MVGRFCWNSNAPMSTRAFPLPSPSTFRFRPSKSTVDSGGKNTFGSGDLGSPLSISGDVGRRWRSVGETKPGSADVLPPGFVSLIAPGPPLSSFGMLVS